ncbi:MAG: AHH domain-containing protein [Pseudomonadota bacterium]
MSRNGVLKRVVMAPDAGVQLGSHPAAAAPLPRSLTGSKRGDRSAKQREVIPFRSINTRSSEDYDASLQRHHLLPRQLLKEDCFGSMFKAVGRASVGFDDFRSNGLLLPATEDATVRMGLPLHRGPHRSYNELVIERVGQIEARWARLSKTDPDEANAEAVMRLKVLQSALRRRLLNEKSRIVLNRKDPLGTGFDFSELDAMAETLWSSTE